MKKLLLVAALSFAASFAHASEQDLLSLDLIGEGSVLTVKQSVLIPAGKSEVNVYKLGAGETRSVDGDLKVGQAIAGCLINMKAESTKVRRIPVNTELTISSIDVDNKEYTIHIEGSAVESLECSFGFLVSDNDATRIATAQEFKDEEVTVENQEEVTLLDFNSRLGSLLTISPSEAEDIGADDSDRATPEAASSAAAGAPASAGVSSEG